VGFVILKLYEDLVLYEEKMSFQEAITDLLMDPDDNKRDLGATNFADHDANYFDLP